MISVTNIKVAFAHFELMDQVTFSINPRDRIALVGKNGAGKSTLLKIIAGIQKPTGGSVVMPDDCKIGYLPQQMGHAKDKTVLEETLTVFAELDRLQGRADKITLQLAERDDYESDAYHRLIVELNEVNDRIHILSGENPRGNAEKTLLGLGFKVSDLNRPTGTFSEGWNMRVELAKLLLASPDILLLDEPTNHLDIESLQWLENYLDNYSGSVMVISHDRTFLDNVTNRTIEIMLGRIHDYKAGYSHYLELRRERIEQQTAAYENQQKVIEKTEDFIARFRYKPTKSNQVQSRIKQLEKMERIVVDQEDNSILHINFPPVIRSGQIAFSCSGLSVRYDKDPIFTKAEIVVERGEKVAFVGRNGEGKTTMMKLITGQLLPCEGKLSLGYNVNLGYYAQNQDELLDKEATVYDTLDKIAVGDVRTKLRDILAAFLFRGEEVDKKTEVLSGGERSRLAMAKLMLQPYNMLALDEPTNHMDIRSKEVMKEALMRYEGTLIIVSHDRTFLDGLVDKIYEFRDGSVKEHLGGIRDFLHRRKLENLRELETRAPEKKEANGESEEKKSPGLSYQEKKERDKILRKLQQTVTRWENRIEQHEQGLALMDKQLAFPPAEGFSTAFYQVYDKEKKALEEAFGNWEQAQTELDRFIKE
jgi:ATP-binding cassette subfamily F protein 3